MENKMTTWEQVRDEWSKAEQMGAQSVLQAAKVGQMLIELKADTPYREFSQACERLLSMKKDSANRLMTLARHLPLLEQHRPDSQRAALVLIKAQQSPKPKKEEDMPFNWIDIACEEGILLPSSNGETRKRVKEQLLGIDPDCFTDKNTDRFRNACRALKAQRDQEGAREEAKRAKEELPKSAQEKLDRALKKWQAIYVAELRQQFAEQLKAEKDKIQAELDAASRLHAEAQAERDAAVEYRLGVDSHMTMEEFQLVRNCLHPDRVPEDRKERFTKAFGIFDRLQKTVNTKKPIEALRRNGWEKVSPYYKPH
jgi:hypothetical protein